MLHFQNEKMDKADILEETVKFVRSSRAKGTIDHSYLKKKIYSTIAVRYVNQTCCYIILEHNFMFVSSVITKQ